MKKFYEFIEVLSVMTPNLSVSIGEGLADPTKSTASRLSKMTWKIFSPVTLTLDNNIFILFGVFSPEDPLRVRRRNTPK